jgi:hypothetical protein
LSGEGKRGAKTCRQLRNGYLHSLSKKDKEEINSRFGELKGYMEKWINLLK